MMYFTRFLRRTFLSALVGVISGTGGALFLIGLEWSRRTRESHMQIIWCLPLAGVIIGFCYKKFGDRAGRGNNLIIDEIHDPNTVLPVRMSPMVLLGTILTNLFGGSAGREGAVVQIAASLSDQLAYIFKIDKEERKVLLVAGAGAGFGAAIGAPWAGMIFGMEFIHIGRLKMMGWFECFVAAFVAYGTAMTLGAPHTHYVQVQIPTFEFKNLIILCLASVLFGVSALAFMRLTHLIEQVNKKYLKSPLLIPFVAGVVIVLLYKAEGSYKYAGLGLPTIQTSLSEMMSYREPILKTIFTALTVGSGFKGGEFIPLVFIGSTLGSALGVLAPAFFQVLAAVGFASVFAGASKTPAACTLMAIELFGFHIAPYAAFGCYVSYFITGRFTIYDAQRPRIIRRS